MNSKHSCAVYLGEQLASYGFGHDHPFGPMRHDVFQSAFIEQQLDQRADILEPATANQNVLELFHSHDYVSAKTNRSFFQYALFLRLVIQRLAY